MSIYGAIPRGGYKQQPKRTPRSLGFARYALGFDGVDDYIDCGNAASLNIIDAGTIVVGVKTTDDTRLFAAIVSKDATTYPTHGWRVVNRIGEFQAVVGLGGPRWHDISFGLIADGKRHHAALTIENKRNVYMYRNGIQSDLSVLPSDFSPSADNVFIGKGSPGHHFKGLIDHVLIYNRALSVAEIRHNQLNYHNPVRGGLVLWLPMEEGSGETVYDKSGFNNHGTLLPAGTGPTWERLRQWELRAATE
ncbi:MAG: hypothetical protein DDT32_02241 [Syntrophomonadaceae bacterium]|nr:hypothetical protein [Bacillota bacterium]